MIDIQQAGVGPLKQNPPVFAEVIVQQIGSIDDVRGQSPAEPRVLVGQGIGIEGRGLHPQRLQFLLANRADYPQLGAQPIGIEQFAHADRGRTMHLVGVGRADAAPGGAD